MGKLHHFYSIVFLILTLLAFGTKDYSIPAKEYTQQEVLDFVQIQKPNFKLLDSTNVPIETLNSIYSDSLSTIRVSNFPVIYSMDLNGNGNQDFIVYTYRITANSNSNSSVDSLYVLNSEIVFHTENGLELVSGSLSWRQGVYKNKSSLNIYTNIFSIEPGIYQSRIPTVGTIRLDKKSILINEFGFGGITICTWTERLEKICYGLVGD